VLNFFVIAGHDSAAKEFMSEANVTFAGVSVVWMTQRREVSEALERGDIKRAIELLNATSKEILTSHPDLAFSLRRHQILSLLRNTSDVLQCIKLAQTCLAPCVKANAHLLPDLEETMSALALYKMTQEMSFEDSDEERRKLVQKVDRVFLEFHGVEKEPVILSLVKNLKWTQKQLSSRNVAAPQLVNLSRGGICDVPQQRVRRSAANDIDTHINTTHIDAHLVSHAVSTRLSGRLWMSDRQTHRGGGVYYGEGYRTARSTGATPPPRLPRRYSRRTFARETD